MIIGIVGTLGAGKTTAVRLLEEEGFRVLNLSDLLREQARERGLTPTQETIYSLANELRQRFGPSAIMEDALNRIQNDPGMYVIDGIRTLPELALLRSQRDVVIIGVDAAEQLRFERLMLVQGSGEREYGITTFEEFLEQQDQHHASDPSRPQLRMLLEQADTIVQNNSTNGALKTAVLAALKGRFPNALASSGSSARKR